MRPLYMGRYQRISRRTEDGREIYCIHACTIYLFFRSGYWWIGSDYTQVSISLPNLDCTQRDLAELSLHSEIPPSSLMNVCLVVVTQGRGVLAGALWWSRRKPKRPPRKSD